MSKELLSWIKERLKCTVFLLEMIVINQISKIIMKNGNNEAEVNIVKTYSYSSNIFIGKLYELGKVFF